MATFFEEESHTFSEYLLVPGYSSAENIPANVSLRTPLVRFGRGEEPAITLNIPMVSAIMGVPCGDQRDFDFARKYGLDIVPIICQKDDPLYAELREERDIRVRSVDWDHAMFYSNESRDSADVRQCFCRYAPRLQ